MQIQHASTSALTQREMPAQSLLRSEPVNQKHHEQDEEAEATEKRIAETSVPPTTTTTTITTTTTRGQPPAISLHKAARNGDMAALKQHFQARLLSQWTAVGTCGRAVLGNSTRCSGGESVRAPSMGAPCRGRDRFQWMGKRRICRKGIYRGALCRLGGPRGGAEVPPPGAFGSLTGASA